jgi:hypothetical protein
MSAFTTVAGRIARQELYSEDLYTEGVADVIVAAAQEWKEMRALLDRTRNFVSKLPPALEQDIEAFYRTHGQTTDTKK